jgi:hypothetical protein
VLVPEEVPLVVPAVVEPAVVVPAVVVPVVVPVLVPVVVVLVEEPEDVLVVDPVLVPLEVLVPPSGLVLLLQAARASARLAMTRAERRCVWVTAVSSIVEVLNTFA